MSQRPIIDAGPSLNFFSINKERLLIGVLGALSAPETVQAEVMRKSQEDRRFRAAATVWRKLSPRWLQILSDDETPELSAVVHRITQQPMQQRLRQPRDLGEMMVVAHAVVAAEAGETMTVLIDDGSGARIATREAGRLQRLRAQGRAVGSIKLVSTLTVLERAAGSVHMPDKATMHDVYQRLRGLDDGLPPIDTTNLLTSARWR
ncbi:hypothetical protein [Micromonospora sp. NBC_01796]|uniref:hypothetical protein n=1 Tax=Micromonospora sp. NBC_01796 TaxID=2975987 RepID=UPI002DD9B953|nr:hypothetical protein [Micromonospora sp. NBC_01796]WSA88101.1 hypothetical protein OIE47_11080 [Micromonospora sp. NBC_01796]